MTRRNPMIAGAIVAVTLTTGAIAYAATALTSVPRDKVGQLQYTSRPRAVTVYVQSPTTDTPTTATPPTVPPVAPSYSSPTYVPPATTAVVSTAPSTTTSVTPTTRGREPGDTHDTHDTHTTEPDD